VFRYEVVIRLCPFDSVLRDCQITRLNLITVLVYHFTHPISRGVFEFDDIIKLRLINQNYVAYTGLFKKLFPRH